MRDPRVAEYFNPTTIKKWKKSSDQEVVIVLYPDDEGVRLNKGRSGAAKGPERILFYLGRLVYRLQSQIKISIIRDFPKKSKLLNRHDWAYETMTKLLKSGVRVVSLGGGHDYGFPDASAYYEVRKGGVVNIDAHLDMRPFVGGRANSGTAFRRLIERYGGSKLTTWGAQIQANADEMLQFAQAHQSKILSWQDSAPEIKGPLGLSICLDAFQGIRAVSAPCFVGLNSNQAIEFLSKNVHQCDWLGLYEVAPKYDPINEDAARLAAQFAYRFLFQLRSESLSDRN